MERKIGEIFEFKKDWYQCVEGRCKDCHFSEKRFLCKQFITKDFCTSGIIFKKLEKVGEPYKKYYAAVTSKTFQKYKLQFRYPKFLGKTNTIIEQDNNNTIDIEIKQTKEDMEEKKQKLDDLVGLYSSAQITYKEFDKELKALYTKQWEEDKSVLKPFNLEEAKEGKPVCTREGRKARIICWDIEYRDNPIAAVVFMGECETVYLYTDKGEYNKGEEDELDLMMLPEKKEGWANVYDDTPIYDTKEEALNRRSKIRGYIDTVKVSWEE